MLLTVASFVVLISGHGNPGRHLATGQGPYMGTMAAAVSDHVPVYIMWASTNCGSLRVLNASKKKIN